MRLSLYVATFCYNKFLPIIILLSLMQSILVLFLLLFIYIYIYIYIYII